MSHPTFSAFRGQSKRSSARAFRVLDVTLRSEETPVFEWNAQLRRSPEGVQYHPRRRQAGETAVRSGRGPGSGLESKVRFADNPHLSRHCLLCQSLRRRVPDWPVGLHRIRLCSDGRIGDHQSLLRLRRLPESSLPQSLLLRAMALLRLRLCSDHHQAGIASDRFEEWKTQAGGTTLNLL
jgi:hypothetical protein